MIASTRQLNGQQTKDSSDDGKQAVEKKKEVWEEMMNKLKIELKQETRKITKQIRRNSVSDGGEKC